MRDHFPILLDHACDIVPFVMCTPNWVRRLFRQHDALRRRRRRRRRRRHRHWRKASTGSTWKLIDARPREHTAAISFGSKVPERAFPSQGRIVCQSSNITNHLVFAKSSESILSALDWREAISRSEHYHAESNDYFVYPRPNINSLHYSLNGAE